MKMKIKILALTLFVLMASQPLTACAETAGQSETELSTETANLEIQLIDPGYSNRDLAGTWDESEAVSITLNGASAQVNGPGATADGSVVTVTEAGVYLLTGSLTDGRVIVDASKDDKVQLVLSGVSVTSSDGPAIHVKQADKVFVTLAESTENTLADSADYELEEGEDEPNAALYSKGDLTINGTGSLTVNGNYNHGINSKDDLVITGGNITVNAVNNGIRGKDSVGIAGGTITINSGGDGIKSTNGNKEGKGWVSIDGGTITITATEGDGIQAQTQLQVTDGEIAIVAGGGAENAPASGSSGFGGGPGGTGGGMPSNMGGGMGNRNRSQPGSTAPAGGTPEDLPEGFAPEGFTPGGMGAWGGMVPDMFDGQMPENMENMVPPEGFLGSMMEDGFGQADNAENGSDGADETATKDTSSEDTSTKGLKADQVVYLAGGTIDCDSADDAVHSNGTIVITGGDLTLKTGDDGIHADEALIIEDGTINITDSYEGLEAKTITINGGEITLKASDDGVNASDGSSGRSVPGQGDDSLYIRITGGLLVVEASGDGIDSNGNIYIEGGTVLINATASGADAAIDYDGSASITGGTVIATGGSGMAQNFGSDSTQPSLLVTFSQRQTAGSLLTLTDSKGNIVASHTPTNDFQCAVISSPDMAVGTTYTLKAGDEEIISIELAGIITSISDTGETIRTFGGGGGMGGGGMGGRGGRSGSSENGNTSQPQSPGVENSQRPGDQSQQEQGSGE